jgi:hypothetical protein
MVTTWLLKIILRWGRFPDFELTWDHDPDDPNSGGGW